MIPEVFRVKLDGRLELGNRLRSLFKVVVVRAQERMGLSVSGIQLDLFLTPADRFLILIQRMIVDFF